MTRVPITSSGVRRLLSLAGGSLRVSFEPVGWNSAPSCPELDELWAISDSAWRCRGSSGQFTTRCAIARAWVSTPGMQMAKHTGVMRGSHLHAQVTN